LQNEFKNIRITPINYKYFDAKKDFYGDLLTKLMQKNQILSINNSTKLQCEIALNALLFYMEAERNTFLLKQNSLNVVFNQNNDVAFVDNATCKYLELISNNSKPKKQKKSVFFLLNNCATKNGMRLLRNSLLEPSIGKTIYLLRFS
jgi:DNA mismatch repair ATPase MutS